MQVPSAPTAVPAGGSEEYVAIPPITPSQAIEPGIISWLAATTDTDPSDSLREQAPTKYLYDDVLNGVENGLSLCVSVRRGAQLVQHLREEILVASQESRRVQCIPNEMGKRKKKQRLRTLSMV